jgi:hypothetical protein
MWHQLPIQNPQPGKLEVEVSVLSLVVEVKLTGAGVTEKVAPRKARAVAVNFILMVNVLPQVVVIELSCKQRSITKEE